MGACDEGAAGAAELDLGADVRRIGAIGPGVALTGCCLVEGIDAGVQGRAIGHRRVTRDAVEALVVVIELADLHIAGRLDGAAAHRHVAAVFLDGFARIDADGVAVAIEGHGSQHEQPEDRRETTHAWGLSMSL